MKLCLSARPCAIYGSYAASGEEAQSKTLREHKTNSQAASGDEAQSETLPEHKTNSQAASSKKH
ncbi:hypothetical protein LF296_16810 [Acinetobacter vivianii]|uniref:Uncharacterized protein n=1 Tax=Acinetobacter vivianii TaxID=1776742 RepID=A0AAJ6NIP9_9GAMM|nr:hypothetical protein [Acinetobacter vivianii]WDZ50937.1 hypothetical protein LF296_16810 [Acinetobacter vivianii]